MAYQQTPKKAAVKPVDKSFKNDSTIFSKDMSSKNITGNIQRQERMLATAKKYGVKKLTGKNAVNIGDMTIERKGGQIKSKKK